MITDEQGREWLFQKLYDDGWRYYVKASNGCFYLTKEKPKFCGDGKSINPYSGGTTICTDLLATCIHRIKTNEVLDIREELGIVDWSKVKVDTPVLVKANEKDDWEKRHFAYFKDGSVYAWLCGATSWSADNDEDVMSWNYAKLAEV